MIARTEEKKGCLAENCSGFMLSQGRPEGPLTTQIGLRVAQHSKHVAEGDKTRWMPLEVISKTQTSGEERRFGGGGKDTDHSPPNARST